MTCASGCSLMDHSSYGVKIQIGRVAPKPLVFGSPSQTFSEKKTFEGARVTERQRLRQNFERSSCNRRAMQAILVNPIIPPQSRSLSRFAVSVSAFSL